MKIEDIKYISTKTGDLGTSSNYSNERFDKDDSLFEVLGTIDELSSNLGVVYHVINIQELKTIQQQLQTINSIIATTKESQKSRIKTISNEDIECLEELENKYLLTASITHEFVLPGSESLASAHLDVARTVCRRAERRLITFIKEHDRKDLQYVSMYLNRLSDLLFILARQTKR